MFDLYESAGQIFTRNMLATHPVILGLFSGSGGTFTLYCPGKQSLTAPSVLMVYQIPKPNGHSSMALAEVVGPYLTSPRDQSWRSPTLSYRSRMQSALDGLDSVTTSDGWRENVRTILKMNLSFLDDTLAKRAVSAATLEKFGKDEAPFLAKNIAWAAQVQVAHWMNVVGDWKAMFGADWKKTIAASNTIYAARQNNVPFSILAQYFGLEVINDRLMLIETMSFTTTQPDMLAALTRIVGGSLSR